MGRSTALIATGSACASASSSSACRSKRFRRSLPSAWTATHSPRKGQGVAKIFRPFSDERVRSVVCSPVMGTLEFFVFASQTKADHKRDPIDCGDQKLVEFDGLSDGLAIGA